MSTAVCKFCGGKTRIQKCDDATEIAAECCGKDPCWEKYLQYLNKKHKDQENSRSI